MSSSEARPRVVCVSGSMRFEEQMRAAAVDLSLEGAIVTGPFVNMKQPDPRWATDELADPIKVALDALHFRKIDLADEVVVVSDETGYVGDSTGNEIAYAEKHGKPVRFMRFSAAPTSPNLRDQLRRDLCERLAVLLNREDYLDGEDQVSVVQTFENLVPYIASLMEAKDVEVRRLAASYETLKGDFGRVRRQRDENGERATEEFAARQEALADLAAAENTADYVLSALAERLEDSGLEDRPEGLADALDRTKWAMDVLAWLHAEAVWQRDEVARTGAAVQQDLEGTLSRLHVIREERDVLRADMRIRQSALNDVLGRDRSQDSRTDYYDAVEDVAELKHALTLAEERIAKTLQALRLDDEKWSVQHGALAVRSERDRVVAERDALRAQLAAAVVLPDDAVHDLIAFWHTKHEQFLDDAARALLAKWGAAPVSESVPATLDVGDPAVEHDPFQITEHPYRPTELCYECGQNRAAHESGVDLPEVEAPHAGFAPGDVVRWTGDTGWFAGRIVGRTSSETLRSAGVSFPGEKVWDVEVTDLGTFYASKDHQLGAIVHLTEEHIGLEGGEEELPEEFIGLVREVHKELTAPRVWSGPDPGADRALLIDAVRYVVEERHAAAYLVQRKVRVGFAKAMRLLDLMEAWGIVSPKVSKADREVLAPADAVDDIVAAISDVLPNTEQEPKR